MENGNIIDIFSGGFGAASAVAINNPAKSTEDEE